MIVDKTPLQIQIKNITPKYDAIEDRIRLSINYQDINNRIDLMLTRSFMLDIVPAIEEFIYKHYPDEIVEDEMQLNLFKSKKQSTQVKNHKTNKKPTNITKTDIEDLELYKGLEDLLLNMQLSYNRKTKNTSLTFTSRENHKATMNCNIDLLKSILESIKNVVPKLAWGIGYL